jgi:hypothetical protein
MTAPTTPTEQDRFDQTLAETAPQLDVIATETLAEEAGALADPTRDDAW